MDIELTTSSQVKAYDLQTNFASSADSPWDESHLQIRNFQ